MITIHSLKSTKKCIWAQSSIKKKSSWPSSHLENWPEGHDGQVDVHINISLTFVKHLERLFTQKNQDNSEKGHLVVSQTFDLNFLPFQGHKNHFSTGHFWREFPALLKSAVKNRGAQLGKESYLHLTLKIDLKVKLMIRSNVPLDPGQPL